MVILWLQTAIISKTWGGFVAPSTLEKSCWRVCCGGCLGYCSCLWWLNTSQHRRRNFRDVANVLWSVVQFIEACKWQHAVFSAGQQDFWCSLCQAFSEMHEKECCLGHFQYIYNLNILYSYFIFVIHIAIHAKLHHRGFVTSEKIWGSFLHLSSLNFIRFF